MITSFLKQRPISFLIATICAIVVGLVSAVVFNLIGPALKVLLSPDQSQQILFRDLFGDYWASAIQVFTNKDRISIEILWEVLPWIMITTAGIRALLMAMQWWIWEWLSEDFAQKTRQRIVKAFLYLDPRARFRNQSIDEQLASTLSNDVRMSREYIVHFWGGLPRELFQVIFYFLSMVILSPLLFVVFVGGLLPAGVVLSNLGRKLRKRTIKALDLYGQVSEWIQQRLQGIETIKHYCTEDLESKKMATYTSQLLKLFQKTIRVKARTSPLLEFIAVLAMVTVLAVSFHLIRTDQVTGSVLMSFFALLAALSQSAAKLGRYYNSNKEGKVAVKRLENLLDDLEKSQLPKILEHHQFVENGDLLQCKGITVQYPEREHPALKDFSFNFQQGQIYCICGPSGAGKSTLLNVMLGLIRPDQGQVIWSSRLESLSQFIAFIPQHVQLAPLTIAENISYPEEKVDESRLKLAIQSAGLSETVMQLSQGYHTEVGEGLTQLSGGQAQRIMLARLFYHQHRLILFDEGTSALDPETESLIYQTLKKLSQEGRTIIMIAHRLSALHLADEVLLLERGELIAADSSAKIQSVTAFQSFIGNSAQSHY